jgi:hypothetical protein
MAISLKKIMNEYGIGVILILIVVAYGIASLSGYLTSKGSYGYEYNTPMDSQYKSASSQPSVSGPSGVSQGGCMANKNIEDPSDLLPKDDNNQWSQLNPTGKGELANINLLKAGYHIGIDTIGQSLRNANLQIRSEPPNPQVYVGPWNQSTITPDFFRPPLEIGCGGQ